MIACDNQNSLVYFLCLVLVSVSGSGDLIHSFYPQFPYWLLIGILFFVWSLFWEFVACAIFGVDEIWQAPLTAFCNYLRHVPLWGSTLIAIAVAGVTVGDTALYPGFDCVVAALASFVLCFVVLHRVFPQFEKERQMNRIVKMLKQSDHQADMLRDLQESLTPTEMQMIVDKASKSLLKTIERQRVYLARPEGKFMRFLEFELEEMGLRLEAKNLVPVEQAVVRDHRSSEKTLEDLGFQVPTNRKD